MNLQALWQLLWVIPSSSALKVSPSPSGLKKLSVENVKTRARDVLSELLTHVGTLVSCLYIMLLFLL
jgi:ubiquitin-protein ligase E3 C